MKLETLSYLKHDYQAKSLNLGNQNLDDYDMDTLLKELQKYHQLENLDLSNNIFSAKGLLRLLPALKVKALQLNDSVIDHRILNDLGKNPYIKSLELDNCGIDDSGAEILSKSKSITALSLNRNQITDISMPAFAENLTLKSLFIMNNPISINGLKTLASNDTLKILLIKNDQLPRDKITETINKIHQNCYQKQMLLQKTIAFSQCIKSEQSMWQRLPKEIIQKILYLTFVEGSSYQKAFRSYLIFRNVVAKKWQTVISTEDQKNVSALMPSICTEKDLQEDFPDTDEGSITLFRRSSYL
jgi:Leucine-rich repeat (LRR) protein